MKKLLFPVSLLIYGCSSSVSVAEIRPNVFTGVYAGLTGGYNFASYDLTISNDINGTSNHVGRFAGPGIMGGGIVGWGALLGESNFYAGIEGLLSKSAKNAKYRQTIGIVNRSIRFQESGPTFGGSFIMGYAFGNAIPYLKFGLNTTNWKTTINTTVAGTAFHQMSQHKKRRRGVSVGIGGLFPITPHLFGGAEFIYTSYGSQKLTENVFGQSPSYKVKPRTNTVLLKIAYKIV